MVTSEGSSSRSWWGADPKWAEATKKVAIQIHPNPQQELVKVKVSGGGGSKEVKIIKACGSFVLHV